MPQSTRVEGEVDDLDLKEFSHLVSEQWVLAILEKQFPLMNEELVEVLARLCTYKGRLPMGAPTSPALSNYAALGMDADLEGLASACGWTYTRFADDLSFSAPDPITPVQEDLIRSAIDQHRFIVNENKIYRYGPGEDKVVTGLYLRDGSVHLAPGYLAQLQQEIERLRAVMLVEGRYQTGMSMRKLKHLQRELLGKLNFAGLVLGPSASEVVAREEQYEAAVSAREDYESASWLEIPYTIF